MFSLAANGQTNDPQQQKKADALGFIYFICNGHKMCITPFIHYGYGSQALGFPAMFALALLVCSCAADPRMVYWLMAWIPALIVQRIITVRSKVITHSRYAGYPWLAMKVPFLKQETTAVQFTEPMICFTLGALLLGWSQFLGLFLMAGFLSLLICGAIENELFELRLMRMQDARLEGEAYGREMK